MTLSNKISSQQKNVFSVVMFVFILFFGLSLFSYTHAQEPPAGSVDNTPGSVSNNPGSVTNTGSGRLENPLKSTTIKEFLIKIVDVLLIFALPIIILFIMYAGFLFVTAQGDTTKITKAKSALMWAVIGGVIILGAQAIITVITGTVTAF